MAPGDTDQLGTTKSSKPEVGQIVRLDSCKFVHYIKSSGAVEDWDTDTSSLPLVPVLHHGAVANGMKKSRFCFNSVRKVIDAVRTAKIARLLIVGMRDWNTSAQFVLMMNV